MLSKWYIIKHSKLIVYKTPLISWYKLYNIYYGTQTIKLPECLLGVKTNNCLKNEINIPNNHPGNFIFCIT